MSKLCGQPLHKHKTHTLTSSSVIFTFKTARCEYPQLPNPTLPCNLRLDDTTGMNVKPSQIDLLQHYLIENGEVQAAASKNIANVNTPGYKAEEITFEEAMGLTESEGERRLAFRRKSDAPGRLDGNNVDIDQQLGELKKSSLKHEVYTQLLAVRVRQMRTAMSSD